MIKFYQYPKCSTCRNAKKWLDDHGVAYQDIDITQTPPSKATLKKILRSGDFTLRNLFNTSGMQYRALQLKDQLPDMSEAEALALLVGNGMLVKRPLVTDGERHTLGFKAEKYAEVWG